MRVPKETTPAPLRGTDNAGVIKRDYAGCGPARIPELGTPARVPKICFRDSPPRFVHGQFVPIPRLCLPNVEWPGLKSGVAYFGHYPGSAFARPYFLTSRATLRRSSDQTSITHPPLYVAASFCAASNTTVSSRASLASYTRSVRRVSVSTPQTRRRFP